MHTIYCRGEPENNKNPLMIYMRRFMCKLTRKYLCVENSFAIEICLISFQMFLIYSVSSVKHDHCPKTFLKCLYIILSISAPANCRTYLFVYLSLPVSISLDARRFLNLSITQTECRSLCQYNNNSVFLSLHHPFIH